MTKKETTQKQADTSVWWLNPTEQERAWWKGLPVAQKKYWLSFKDYASWSADASTDKVTVSEKKLGSIWGWSVDFLYLHWEHLSSRYPQVMLTTISPEQLQASMGRCSREHSERDLPDVALRWGTRAYIEAVKHSGIKTMEHHQMVFLDGYTDRFDNHWCGTCFACYRLMEMGAQVDFSEMSLYCLGEETRGIDDYTGWLSLAIHGSPVLLSRVIEGVQAALSCESKKNLLAVEHEEDVPPCQRSA